MKDSNTILTSEEQKPIYHVATHWKYTYKNFGDKFESVLKEGVCLTYGEDKKDKVQKVISDVVYEKICTNIISNSTLELMFNFQGDDRINCGYWDCFAMQESYAEEVASYGFQFSRKALSEIK